MNNPPHFKGFKPIGLPEENHPVVINYEEYEAIRLSDYELNGHLEASKKMGVSRPTYTRIYESARRKVAQAFTEGKAIVFEGGKVYFDSEWYSCNHCGCWFNHPEVELEIKNCSLCGSTNIHQCDENPKKNEIDQLFKCPECGKEVKSTMESSLQDVICSTCNCKMIGNKAAHLHRTKNRKCN